MPDYTIRIAKGFRSRDIERSWSNTYEVMAGGTGPTDLVDMAEALVEAEQAIHLTDVQFLQYTISTWLPDSHPYNPDSFITVGLVGIGTRGEESGTNPTALDYNVCLMVHRNPATGRTGRIFYRGALLETEVQMGGDGRFILSATGSNPDALITKFNGDYLTTMGPYIGNPTGEQLALISATGSSIFRRRPVQTLTIGGVVINKRNHRYFDRA